MVLYSKRIYLEDRVFDGYLIINNGKIEKITKEYGGPYEDFGESMIIPGFIDLHIHGFATGSFWLELTKESVREMQKHLPKNGVTAFLPTSGADDPARLRQGIYIVKETMEGQQPGAEVIGIHLEGPFINKEFRGMQKEEACIHPDLPLIKDFYTTAGKDGVIRLITLAPELPGAKEVIQFASDRGTQVSIGHSAATFEEITALKDYGLGGVTHMFSGMKGFHHRELGVAGTALYYGDLYCEFAKQTGLTVRHEAFDIAYRLKGSDRIFLTTDCSGLAQSEKPQYHYIRKATYQRGSEDHICRITHDNGRIEEVNRRDYEAVKDVELGYLGSVKNMMAHSPMSIFDMIKITSTNPAKYIHVFDRKGSIAGGKDADLLVINDDLDLRQVFVGGVPQDIG